MHESLSAFGSLVNELILGILECLGPELIHHQRRRFLPAAKVFPSFVRCPKLDIFPVNSKGSERPPDILIFFLLLLEGNIEDEEPKCQECYVSLIANLRRTHLNFSRASSLFSATIATYCNRNQSGWGLSLINCIYWAVKSEWNRALNFYFKSGNGFDTALTLFRRTKKHGELFQFQSCRDPAPKKNVQLRMQKTITRGIIEPFRQFFASAPDFLSDSSLFVQLIAFLKCIYDCNKWWIHDL